MNDSLHIPSVTGIDLELRVAGPGGRSYAFVIDWHIRLILALAWFVGMGLLYSGADGFFDFEDSDSREVFIVIVPAMIIYFLYHPILEVLMAGRTPGKRMAGVRIVTTSGDVPSVGALLIRNILRLLDSLPSVYVIGLVCTMFTRQSVRIGDLAAGTLLVYDDAEKIDAADELNSGTIQRLGLDQAELIRDLVARWQALDAPVRRDLAVKLLSRAQAPPRASATEADLLDALRQQLG